MIIRGFVIFLAGGMLCYSLAACSDDERRSEFAGLDPIEARSVIFTVSDRPRGENTPVTIRGPKTIRAGLVKFTLRNKSTFSPHDAQVLRIRGDHSVKETIATTIGGKPGRPIPEWITDGAGVGTVNPGKSAESIQVFKPGTYYLLDDETASLSHTLHAYNGGVAKFKVVGKTTDTLPKTDARIVASEYSFKSKGVRPGKNRLTFENAGYQLHHLIALPYRGNATFEDVVGELMGTRDPKSGPIPLNREAGQGTAVIDGGQKQIIEMDFKPGKYALICFITDREGGPPHVARGMIDELVVE